MTYFFNLLKIILLGIVEGITEWLPISSTGHMVLINYFLPLKDVSDGFAEMFEYVIQFAAILAVVVIFWKRLFPLDIKRNIYTPSKENTATTTNPKKLQIAWKKDILNMWVKVILACLPALLALVIDKLFSELSPIAETAVIASTLILYGIAFILVETFHKTDAKIQKISQLSYKYAFFIGCMQLLAVIPGTSRSGVTILGALLLGVSRTVAAEFTFFLAIPTMVGASAYKLLMYFLEVGAPPLAEVGYLLIGSIVAFIVSIFAVKFLMNFVKKHDFKVFGWYRIGLGILVLLFLFFI